MTPPKIYSNYHKRELQYLFELDPKDQEIVKERFDWMDGETLDCEQFVRYRGEWYGLCDFMAVHNTFYNPNPPQWLKRWDGYLTDSFFSGVVIRYVRDDWDDDKIQIGMFIS